MIKLSVFHRLPKLINQTVSHIIDHKVLITVTLIIIISLAVFIVFMVKLGVALSKVGTLPKTSSDDIFYASSSGVQLSDLNNSVSTDAGIMMSTSDNSNSYVSDDAPTYTPPATPTPFPLITVTPLPTTAPVYNSTSTSCAGTPNADNSQLYVSSASTPVNNAVTVTVDLLDCKNNYAPVSDNLSIALSNSDSAARINGNSPPVTIQSQNGKATFSVNSSNVGTDTFVVTDTSRSFTVTMPGYHNPSITFTSGSSAGSGNTNCTTSAGAPNAWYSDVYPNPPITTTTGSVTLLAVIRDCFKNTTTVNDTLSISLSSGDSGTQVNGNNLPYSLSAQDGQASFTVSSQVNGTVTLVIQDTTSGFTITDPYYDKNPSITFSGSLSTPTPTPTDTTTPTSAPTDTSTPAPTTTSTPSPTTTPVTTATTTPTPTTKTGPS